MIRQSEYGGVSERFKELVLKTSDRATCQGFESPPLRHTKSLEFRINTRDSRLFSLGRKEKDVYGVMRFLAPFSVMFANGFANKIKWGQNKIYRLLGVSESDWVCAESKNAARSTAAVLTSD